MLSVIIGKSYAQTPGVPASNASFKINEGSSIILHANSDNASAYQWYKDSTVIKGAINKDFTTMTMGTYSVIAYNSEGCPSSSSDKVDIIVIPSIIAKPDTNVDLQVSIASAVTKTAPGDSYNYTLTANNNSAIDGTDVQVTYSLPPILSYVPQPGSDSSVQYNPTTRILTWKINKLEKNDPQNLTVNVTVLQSGSIQSVVKIKGNQPDSFMGNNVAEVILQATSLIIPNVFTPNGDGKNDTFYIPGLEAYPETELSIMNKSGNSVLERKNYQNDWTGDGLAEGTYFYILRLKTSTGLWDVHKGYLTLLRSKLQ
jgi:gliding motility-associated-like protein/uncharacterized repeat protein (TIGR01451 family)